MRYLIFLVSFLFAFEANKPYLCKSFGVEVIKNKKVYYLDDKEKLKLFLKDKYEVRVVLRNDDISINNYKIRYKSILPDGNNLYENKSLKVVVNLINDAFVVIEPNARVYYKCH